MPLEPVPATALRRAIDPSVLDVETTAEVIDPAAIVGQDRAVEALRFGVGIRQPGYNVFVLGAPGSGRRRLIDRVVRAATAAPATLHDWCYVERFDDVRRPRLLRLPAGRASALKADLARWLEELASAIPAAFESDEYRARLGRIDAETGAQHQQAVQAIGERAMAEGVALLRTPAGFSFAPLSGKEVMAPEEYQHLPPERQRELAALVEKYERELEDAMHRLVGVRRTRMERVRALEREVTEIAVRQITAELRERYADVPDVAAHLDAARADVIERAELFRKPVEGAGEMPEAIPRRDIATRRYAVNVFVDNAAAAGRSPIVFEDHPAHANLVGRIEHLAQYGALITDFNLVRAGALHRANGGTLVVDALQVLTEPFAWDALKRALRSREVRMESIGQTLGLAATQTLEPEPMPLDVKVILYGPPSLYHLLQAADPEFGALFRVQAELAAEAPRSPPTVRAMAGVVAGMVAEHRLRPFDRTALGAVIEHASRLAEDADKLSLDLQGIEELVQEADWRAAGAGRAVVTRADVDSAVVAARERSRYLEERFREMALRGVLLLSTAGAAVGQVNGLAVIALGRARFGHVQRITATARIGHGELIDIEREVQLGGAIHSKGVLTLSAFLARRFAATRPLSITATLAFEQQYGMVEGDSASVGELVALVSSIADVPVRQCMAITGAVNQQGEVQAIGGVNEKIEGFFDLCAARGLDGTHGVVIPAANRAHLMLRPDVVAAVAAGRFRVHAIERVDEAIELLTGLPAGEENAQGRFPPDSVNGKAEARLARFMELARRHEQPAEPRRRLGARRR